MEEERGCWRPAWLLVGEGKVARPVGEGLRRQAGGAVPDGLEQRMAFVHLRELIATNRDLARRLDELGKR